MLKRIVLVMAAGAMVGLALVMAVPSGPAYAVSCASGDTCIQELTNANIDSGVTIDVRVTVNNTSGTNTVITVAYISSNILNTPLGIDQFGYNSSVAASILPSGWSQAKCPTGGCEMDSFGKFASEIDRPGGTDLSFSFTLASLVTDFPANDNKAEFAAHIRYDGDCSAFVSDGTPSSIHPAGTCRVAEPSALFLVGLGLVGVGYVARTRWSSRRPLE